MGLSDEAARVIQFSVADAAKQANKPERGHFGPKLYAEVQRLVTTGEAFQDSTVPRTFIFRALIESDPFVAVVQFDAAMRQAFLKSFRRTDGRVRSKWRRLGDGS